MENGLNFVIKDRIKTTRKVLRPKIVSCVSSDIEEFNVEKYVFEYIEKTKEFRKDGQLFISWKTKKPVSRPTIARWLKLVLKLAGIDTSKFTSHSYRGAGLSHAFFKGAPIDKIVTAGNWTNVNIFNKFYRVPS